MEQIYVPGMRVEIRGEEWVIRKVQSNSRSTQTLYAEGLSGVVEEMEAIFLSELEEIKIIDPTETVMVTDTSAYFRDSKLQMESLLRKRAFSGNTLYTGYKAAMDVSTTGTVLYENILSSTLGIFLRR